jgi:hypothetical protein
MVAFESDRPVRRNARVAGAMAALVASILGLGFALRNPGDVLRWTDGLRHEIASQMSNGIEPIAARFTANAKP